LFWHTGSLEFASGGGHLFRPENLSKAKVEINDSLQIIVSRLKKVWLRVQLER